jgi:hypothetical protein
VYIDNVNFDHKEVTDPKEIARLVKSHVAHLGKVEVYYETPYNMLSPWQKLLRALAGH